MSKSKRLIFSFDERSFENLERMKLMGNYASYADIVRDSLQINGAIQLQVRQGFTEIIVRNPKTQEEKILVTP